MSASDNIPAESYADLYTEHKRLNHASKKLHYERVKETNLNSRVILANTSGGKLSKLTVMLSLIVGVCGVAIGLKATSNRDYVRLNRSLDKGILMGERLGESYARDGSIHTVDTLKSRAEKCINNPTFRWDAPFRMPGVDCTTIGELADSGLNEFTEALRELKVKGQSSDNTSSSDDASLAF